MKFRYKKYAPGVLRPVIPIEIVYKNLSVPYEVLVDSGADFCIFDAEIADILGIDVESGEKDEIAGITGAPAPIYYNCIKPNLSFQNWKETPSLRAGGGFIF